ncbi:MAG: TolC family protein [Myxococcota bacterium]
MIRFSVGLLLAAALWLTCARQGHAQRSEDPDEPPVLDLSALTELAEESYPSLEAALHRIEAAEARLAEATISPYFQFNVTGGVTIAPEARGTPVFSPDGELPLSNTWRPVLRIGVEGAIPIYTFGKLQALRRAARAGVDAAEGTEAQAKAQLRFDVRRAYYTLQLALDTLQMISEGERGIERAVAYMEERIEAEDPEVNEHDRWRLSTTLAEIQARRSEAERLDAGARAALQALTNRANFRIPDCPIEPVSLEPQPLTEYLRRSRANRPELDMLRAGLRARRADLQANEARYFPDLALALRANYSYGPGVDNQSNPFVADLANQTSLGGAIIARWSLDLWGNAHRVRRSQALLLETEAQAEEARRGIALEVRTTYQAVEDARRREEAWRVGHRDSRRWFVASSAAYQVGALEPRDLVDSVRAYFNARFNHLMAIRDFNTNAASLERVTGRTVLPPDAWEQRCE